MTILENKNKLNSNKEENGIEDFHINSYVMDIVNYFIENGTDINNIKKYI